MSRWKRQQRKRAQRSLAREVHIRNAHEALLRFQQRYPVQCSRLMKGLGRVDERVILDLYDSGQLGAP